MLTFDTRLLSLHMSELSLFLTSAKSVRDKLDVDTLFYPHMA